MSGLIPERGERPVRKGGICLLGLLHAEDVGLGVANPFLHPGKPGGK
jgi:hypothetical protein